MKTKGKKLSTQLVIDFGIVVAFLIAVVVTQFFMLNSIRLRKDRFANAVAINESIQLTRKTTLDYYLTGSDESVDSVEKQYQQTKSLVTQGLDLYKDGTDKDALNTMIGDVDKYYDSFLQYKEYVDENIEHAATMEKAANRITLRLDDLNSEQETDMRLIQMKNKNMKDVDSRLLVEELSNEFEVAQYTSKAVQTIKNAIGAEKDYITTGTLAFDEQVYVEINTLRSQCDWLYESFETEDEKETMQNIQGFIDDYVALYEEYKVILVKQQEEETKLNELALNITNSASELSAAQQQSMEDDMLTTNILSILLGIFSVLAAGVTGSILIRRLNKVFTNMISKLNKSTQLITDTSSELADASQQLSQGSSEQAASIEETSATMDETYSMVKQNTENTQHANKISKEASYAATKGSKEISDMHSSMSELEKSSNEIANIIKVINDIAFQTNMLALNAAVEAARAGEAGLGFAVVAEEVRSLAQKSAKAATDTAEIIDKNIELSKYGIEISENVNVALEDILTKTDNVNNIISEITTASEEQAKGTNQVTIAIGEMEKVVQVNANTAQENANSAAELQKMARDLEHIVNDLSNLVNGSEVNSKGKSKLGKKIKTSSIKKIKGLKKKGRLGKKLSLKKKATDK